MKLIKLSVLAFAALATVLCASCAKKQTAAPTPGYVEYGK